jgi:hypothetical protein
LSARQGRVGVAPYVEVGRDGRVYVAFSDLRSNGTTKCTRVASNETWDVFIDAATAANAFPPAGGAKRLSNDVVTAKHDHYLATLAVDQVTNEVQSSYYGTDRDVNRVLTDQFFVRSTNAGVSYSAPTRVTTASSDASDPGFLNDYGDYETSDAAGGLMIPTWSDARAATITEELYALASVAPTVTGFTPTSGPQGTAVTITGTGLGQATGVKFSGVAATFTVNSNTQITATVPAGAPAGRISVVTPAGTALSATSFTVT